MPGKHNAGGCGCCGNPSACWSCDHPVSIVSAMNGTGTCCSAFAGTFVFPSAETLEFFLCQHQWNVEQPFMAVVSDRTPNSVGACANMCQITLTDNDGLGDLDTKPYTCLIDHNEVGTPFCRTEWLVQGLVWYEVHIRDVTGVPTITVTLSHTYEYRSFELVAPGNVCGGEDASLEVWTVVDTYESEIDCNDASTVLTHISRTLTDPNGGSIDPPTGFTWGLSSSTYTLCDAPTLTLNLT